MHVAAKTTTVWINTGVNTATTPDDVLDRLLSESGAIDEDVTDYDRTWLLCFEVANENEIPDLIRNLEELLA